MIIRLLLNKKTVKMTYSIISFYEGPGFTSYLRQVSTKRDIDWC